MNSLSWFLYCIELVGGLQNVFAWTAVLIALSFAARTIHACIAAESADNRTTGYDGEDLKARQAVWAKVRLLGTRHLICFLLCILAYNVIPSRQTLLLIAGSELGDRIVRSNTVQSVVDPGMDLVKLWIKQETDRLTPKPKESK